MNLLREEPGTHVADIPKPIKVFFPNLDGLRFFCFLSVFFFHSFGSQKIDMQQNEVYIFIKQHLFRNGMLGVNFFFVLSGFLITFLLLVEKQNFKKIKIGNFYLRRILRIWPLFYFCVVFGFFIFPQIKQAFGEVPNEPARLAYYVTFLSNFDIVYNTFPDSSVLGVLWSVSIEEQFYLFWPLVIAFVPKRWLPVTLLLLIIASFIFRMEHAGDRRVQIQHTFSCISDLMVGGIFAYLSMYSKKFVEMIRTAPRRTWVVLYISVAVLYFFSFEIFKSNAILIALERLVISLSFALVIVEQCYAEHSLFKMSTYKTISKLGKYTFGLYCLHSIGGLIANRGLGLLGVNNNYFGILVIEPIVSLSISIIMAIISYHFYELPFLRLKERCARITKN